MAEGGPLKGMHKLKLTCPSGKPWDFDVWLDDRKLTGVCEVELTVGRDFPARARITITPREVEVDSGAMVLLRALVEAKAGDKGADASG